MRLASSIATSSRRTSISAGWGCNTTSSKVLDFGLVKRQVEADVTFTQATGLGVVAGTPAYMAPETALGGDVDGRADLYALGCVAYYLLTGTLVFEGQGLQQIVKRLHDDPVPPRARTELPIPAELDALVMSLLAREPGAGRRARQNCGGDSMRCPCPDGRMSRLSTGGSCTTVTPRLPILMSTPAAAESWGR